MSGDNQDQDFNVDGGAEDVSAVDSNYLEMSDDDIANMSFPDAEPSEDPDDLGEPGEDGNPDNSDPDDANADPESDDPENEEDPDDDPEDPEEDDDPDNTGADGDDDPDANPEGQDPEGDPDNSEEDDANPDSDAQAMLNELFSPFKANNRDISVNNIKDARRLMQMGANYNKKMQSLKPHLKIVKMLDNNGLLDESKLNLAIEVMQGNPDAISKLIKDKGIETLALDPDKADSYQQKDHTVDDAQVVMDEVLDEIKHSPSYGRTLSIVKNELDEDSRKVLLTSPEAIKIINEHVDSGLYDQVMNIVESKRALGELPNSLSDLDAYKMVGKQLQDAQSRGTNSNVNNGTGQRQSNADVEKTKKREQEKQRTSRKKAAGSPANTKGGGKKSEPAFDPLGMDDAEFNKMAAKLGF